MHARTWEVTPGISIINDFGHLVAPPPAAARVEDEHETHEAAEEQPREPSSEPQRGAV